MLRTRDVAAGGFMPVGGDRETSGGFNAVVVSEQRANGYFSSIRARRFVATTEGATVTASNGFTATAPRFTLEAGATNELIVRSIDVCVLAAGTTNMQVRVVIDPDARYSSGGTSGTVGARTNMNVGSAATGSYTFHYGGITATATDADEREIYYGTITNAVGGRLTIPFDDGLIIGASGTLLVYVIDAGATGTASINMVLEDANVQ
jgi:hypothetical protein